jgi:hypothetical protein
MKRRCSGSFLLCQDEDCGLVDGDGASMVPGRATANSYCLPLSPTHIAMCGRQSGRLRGRYIGPLPFPWLAFSRRATHGFLLCLCLCANWGQPDTITARVLTSWGDLHYLYIATNCHKRGDKVAGSLDQDPTSQFREVLSQSLSGCSVRLVIAEAVGSSPARSTRRNRYPCRPPRRWAAKGRSRASVRR